jgi:hypothetical protein
VIPGSNRNGPVRFRKERAGPLSFLARPGAGVLVLKAVFHS